MAGETTKKGFYLYDDRRKPNPDPELKKYIEKSRGISGVSVDPKVGPLQKSFLLILFTQIML